MRMRGLAVGISPPSSVYTGAGGGVKSAEPHDRHPHPNLPPSRGKEFMARLLSAAAFSNELYMRYSNTYACQPIKGRDKIPRLKLVSIT